MGLLNQARIVAKTGSQPMFVSRCGYKCKSEHRYTYTKPVHQVQVCRAPQVQVYLQIHIYRASTPGAGVQIATGAGEFAMCNSKNKSLHHIYRPIQSDADWCRANADR